MLSYTKLSNMGPTIIKVFFSTFQTAILFPRWPVDVAARIFSITPYAATGIRTLVSQIVAPLYHGSGSTIKVRVGTGLGPSP